MPPRRKRKKKENFDASAPAPAAEPDHATRAEQYAYEAANGVIDVPEPIRKAYKKWFKYKEAYTWRPDLLNQACMLFEMMSLPEVTHLAGLEKLKAEGKDPLKLRLLPWQCAMLSWIFGFMDPETGCRVVHQMHLCVPRKSGKSTIAAAICLSELIFPLGGAIKPEILCVGTNDQNAQIVFGKITSMLTQDLRAGGDISREYKIKKTKDRVTCDENMGYIERLSTAARSLVGFNARVIFIDEIAVLPDREAINILLSGMGAHPNRLMVTATTPSIVLPMSAYQPTRQLVLDWCDDDDLGDEVGLMYEADIKDDIEDEAVWARANPSYGHIADRPYYLGELKRALASEQNKRSFEIYNLCKPLSGSSVWISEQDLRALDLVENREEADISPDVIHYIGLDLSDVSDTTSICLLSINPKDDWQEARWIIYYPDGTSIYEDERGVEQTAHATKMHLHYQAFADDGYVKMCAGRTMNHDLVAADLATLIDKYNPRGVIADTYDAIHAVRRKLSPEHQKKFFQVSKSASALSAHARILETWVKNGSFMIEDNPLVFEHFLNTHVKENPLGGILLTKVTPDSRNKIDAVDALVNAIAGYDTHTNDPKFQGTVFSPYDNEDDDDDDGGGLSADDLIFPPSR